MKGSFKPLFPAVFGVAVLTLLLLVSTAAAAPVTEAIIDDLQSDLDLSF